MGSSWIASSAASTMSPFPAPTNAQRKAYPKSDINLVFKDHYSSKVYTSLSPVAGDLVITTKRDVRFDSIQILLLGHSRTSFDGMATPHEITHTFLKMVMPISESAYPVPRVLEADRTYKIPFNFVIPSQLTINACNHAGLSAAMQDHHVRLPPTLGTWDRDDMAPRMAQVEYSIKARVIREDGDVRTRIMEVIEPIRVMPTSAEEPPLNVTSKDQLYRMTKTKTLRKNLLATKIGSLTAEALQPGPAVLSPDGRRVMSHPMARIKLAFTPESQRTLPPTITSVTAKVTAHTYFSSAPISSFPNLSEWNTPYLLDRRGQFFMSTTLPPVTLSEQPAWTSASSLTRRDSGYSSCNSSNLDISDLHLSSPGSPKPQQSTPTASSSTTSTTTTTTALINIPLSLPTSKKTFVPTFHSCIISRVYTAHLTVNLSARGSANTISLIVPLQVAVDGPTAPLTGSPTPATPPMSNPRHSLPPTERRVSGEEVQGGDENEEAADRPPSFEEIAADEHLRPRLLLVPDESTAVREGRGDWMFASSSAGQSQQPAAQVGEELPGYGESGWGRRTV
ncbi:uncharacterized protein C8A04DRAFT_10291 [Dichotomopilus funicola]|uniref:Bul1 C-terminal domain-containing protein n=1 Tax=Dichotomopilus funicola TaxID=1934379 RepID=A0AAN6ZP96_9PEZI|nr:hypothetical protein C8A04DRAFT_10291 [Dichotomopilus funicola]